MHLPSPTDTSLRPSYPVYPTIPDKHIYAFRAYCFWGALQDPFRMFRWASRQLVSASARFDGYKPGLWIPKQLTMPQDRVFRINAKAEDAQVQGNSN
jgi:hypothetical protein